ncbi:MAG: tetratricopeptide repeat protein [Ktedonobacteraceae bacterium]|nr:tetratricopeptide repeat protein [Ktedonobacteraceae bacterium]
MLENLKTHLSALKRQGFIDTQFYDSENEEYNNLEQSGIAPIDQANIYVLLISPDFLDSKRCYEVEMQRALERWKAKEADLILVLLRSTNLEGTPLEGRKFLLNGKPLLHRSSDIDAALSQIVGQIGKIAKELMATKNRHSSPETSMPLNTIPYWPSPFFTDRKAILASLHDGFAHQISLHRTCIQALSGPVGVGKTQIAVEYAHLYKEQYKMVLWFEAASRSILSDKITSYAEQLSLTEHASIDEQHRFDAFKRWLQQYDHWLLVLDNLEEMTLIEQIVPVESTGHVLLTTLTQETGHLASVIPVIEMTDEDGALFLLRRAKLIEGHTSTDTITQAAFAQATSIVQAVGGSSLALDQAGAYIDRVRCSLARYLQLYHKEGARLLAVRGLAQVHPDPITETLSLNFQKVEQSHPYALRLLYLFAFLYPDAIPEEMIEQGTHTLDKPLQKLAADVLALENVIALLLKYALVQRRIESRTLSIHRVVQAILKEKLPTRQQRRWALQTVRLVSSVFPKPDLSNWSTCEKYFSQARHCAELIDKFDLVQKEALHLVIHLGEYCYQRAYYRDAETYLTNALQSCEQTMGSDHLDTAHVLNNLARVYHKLAHYQEAEEHYQRAETILKQIWGTEHSEIAQVLNDLALLYSDWGKYQEAEVLYQEVISMYEHTIGSDDPETAAALNNLATVYDELGKHSLATSLYQSAFSIEERTLGIRHPSMALSMTTLAGRYEDQKDYPQAEKLYQRTLAIQEQILGPEHPDIAQTLNNLAGLYEVLHKYEDAEKLYERALHIYEKILGPKHPDTACVLNNLAYLSCQQGQYQRAEDLYQRALYIYGETPGPEHPDVASILNNLGTLYHLMGKDERAESFLLRGLAIRERVFGEEHIDTGRSLKALIELLMEQRRYEEAKPLYQRNLAIIQQTFGVEDPDVALASEEYTTLLALINEQKDQ